MPESKLKHPEMTLKRQRKQKPQLGQVGEEIIERGADVVAPSKSDKRTRDISVPLNEYYRNLLDKIVNELSGQIGAKVSRRSWTSRQMIQCIEKMAEELNLEESKKY